MSARFSSPAVLSVDDLGTSDPGATLTFYIQGSSTVLKDTFTDSTDTTINPNPLSANGAGIFPDIYGSGFYRVVFKDSNDRQQWAYDNVIWTDGT